jgi:hypothetical protein
MRGSSAASCNATAPPNEAPIKFTGPGLIVVDDLPQILLFVLVPVLHASPPDSPFARLSYATTSNRAPPEAVDQATLHFRDCRQCHAARRIRAIARGAVV